MIPRVVPLLVVTVLLSRAAGAASIETLLMPGKLIEGHAKYETECSRCHARLRSTTQSALCQACHEKVAHDVKGQRGYHGRIQIDECRTCHTDHQGRAADVVHLDSETFDHRHTDFRLKGAHRKTPCTACHRAEKRYREAPGRCFDCHERDDIHKGELGEDCTDCHDERGWQRATFDHDETDFPLLGEHREVSCESCHPAERYQHTPEDCYSCHLLNDEHRGRYGRKCQDCHSPRAWDRIEFDHDRDTDYRLIARHKDLACDRCHTGRLYEDDTDQACYACHKNDDSHKGRNGRECNDCHSPRSWSKATFDHDKDTDFRLRGRHAEALCVACHRGDIEDDKPDTTCFACHRQDDVHRGEQGERCERCHDEGGWDKRIVFDHDLTRFPLIGLHTATPCEECHISATFRDAALGCRACHGADDVHQRQLGADCALCHNPNGWGLWEFDHDHQTEYRLDGEHAGLDCLACHTEPVETTIRLARTCVACHRADDVHSGNFGRRCERCHNTESFSDARIQ